MRSAIYTVNTTAQAVAVGDDINLGSISRKFGCGMELTTDGIVTKGSGYYDVSADFAVLGTTTAGGTAVIQLQKNGIDVPGAVAYADATTGEISTVGIHALVRELCYEPTATISFVIKTTGATINNASVVVEKI